MQRWDWEKSLESWSLLYWFMTAVLWAWTLGVRNPGGNWEGSIQFKKRMSHKNEENLNVGNYFTKCCFVPQLISSLLKANFICPWRCNFTSTICWKGHLLPFDLLHCLCTFVKNQWDTFIWGDSCAFFSVSLIYVSIPLPQLL